MIIQALPHYPAETSGGGGSITYVGGKSSTYGGTGATVTISLTDLAGGLGSAPVEGDFVLISLGVTRGTNLDLALVTSGYTEECDLFRADAANLGVYTKIMGGGPDTSVEIQAHSAAPTQANVLVRIQAWRGVNATSPMDVTPVTSGGGPNSGIAVTPAITPVTPGALVVGTAVAYGGNPLNVSPTMSNPGSYSPFSSSKRGQAVSYLGAKVWSGSGAEGPWTNGGTGDSTAAWCACALALRPA